MSRVKISEYRAKILINGAYGSNYDGICIDLSKDDWIQTIKKLNSSMTYVVKVDQAVKKRNKLGLVYVNRDVKVVHNDLLELKEKGYEWALVEPFVKHDREDEKFIAMLRTKEGIQLTYSEFGGVDIEDHKDSLQTCLLPHFALDDNSNTTALKTSLLKPMYELFIDSHMTYLEVNPALIAGSGMQPLDAAIEVDSSAMFFVGDSWGKKDIRNSTRRSESEKIIEELDDNSPASFNLKMLDKNAGIYLLLSGGGASIVVADEFASQGLHDQIANYGEYSGNPNEDETYAYTKEVLSLMLASTAKKKILVIGGGTANFTDVAKTFNGVIRALEEVVVKLKKQRVAVFVRRGGPNYELGLHAMREFLIKADLVHKVYGPEFAISEMVQEAVKEVRNV